MRAAVLLVLVSVALSAGCVDEEPRPPYKPPEGARSASELPPLTPWAGPNVTIAGRVLDAASGAPLANASVSVSLVTLAKGGEACGGAVPLGWSGWSLDVDANGTFGPLEMPEPQGNGSAFRVGGSAPGYAAAGLDVDPRDANLSGLAFRLHPASTLVLDASGGGTLAAWARVGDAERIGRASLVDGNASVPVAAGEVDVVYVGPGRVPARVSVTAPAFGEALAASPALAALPEEWPSVAGRVEGAGAAGALVVARDASGALAAVSIAMGGGDFEMTLPGPGNFTLEAVPARGVAPAARATVVAEEGEVATALLELAACA